MMKYCSSENICKINLSLEVDVMDCRHRPKSCWEIVRPFGGKGRCKYCDRCIEMDGQYRMYWGIIFLAVMAGFRLVDRKFNFPTEVLSVGAIVILPTILWIYVKYVAKYLLSGTSHLK